MACQFGSEKKFAGDTTIVINPYDNMNLVAEQFMMLAGIPRIFEFNADSICSTNPVQYEEVLFADLANWGELYRKSENNAKNAAWFKGCQCRPFAPDPSGGGGGGQLPPPEGSVTPQFVDACQIQFDESRWEIQAIGWEDEAKQIPWVEFYRIIFEGSEEISLDKSNIQNGIIGITIFGQQSQMFATFPASYYDAKITFCLVSVIPIPPIPPDIVPMPDPCENSATCKYVSPDFTKADANANIAELKLWITDSNNRIRDELYDYIFSQTRTLLEAVLDAEYDLKISMGAETTIIKDNANNNRDDIKASIIANNQVITNWVDGAKNQILTSIAASLASVIAAVTALGATIAAALATQTTAITTAITATQTALQLAITTTKNSIEKKVDDKFVEYHPKRLYVTVRITSYPANLPITHGIGDAPDKIVFGWIIFKTKLTEANLEYYPREFICFENNIFKANQFGENVEFVLHLVGGVTAITKSNYLVEKT